MSKTNESKTPVADILGQIAGIEVEAVIKGALQRITFKDGTNPAAVKDMLLALDEGALVRDAFPVRGGGGNRDTKLARALVLNPEVRESGTFIKITAVSEDGEDLTIAVPKKKAPEWLPALEALGKLTEKNLAKIKAAFDAKKAATVILSEDEQFGIRFWKMDDGGCFMESMQAEPPAEGNGNA